MGIRTQLFEKRDKIMRDKIMTGAMALVLAGNMTFMAGCQVPWDNKGQGKDGQSLVTEEDPASETSASESVSDPFWGFHQHISEKSDDSSQNKILSSGYKLIQYEMTSFVGILSQFIKDGFTSNEAHHIFLITDPDNVDKAINVKQTDVKDGVMKFNMLSRIVEIDESVFTDYEITYLFQVNGNVCDFEIGGKKSQNGILKTNLHTNTDLSALFEAKDIPVNKGENTYSLTVFCYSPKLDRYISTQAIPGCFVSDKAYEGKACVPSASEDKSGRTVSITDEDDIPPEKIYESRLVTDEDFISFDVDDMQKDVFTLKPSPDLHYFLINDNADKGSSNRKGLMVFFDNGELIPVWNGKYFGSMSLTDKDIRKELITKVDLDPSGSHNILWGYIETSNDKEDPYPIVDSVRIIIKD